MPLTDRELQQVRSEILRFFTRPTGIADLYAQTDLLTHYAKADIKKVVYSLADAGLLFVSGATRDTVYATTEAGRRIIE